MAHLDKPLKPYIRIQYVQYVQYMQTACWMQDMTLPEAVGRVNITLEEFQHAVSLVRFVVHGRGLRAGRANVMPDGYARRVS